MKPNILVITTDQQSATMMSCMGNEDLKTPAMDMLAKRGVLFTQCVCANPVCMPSRFSLFTGHMPLDMGMTDNTYKHLAPCPQSIIDDGMGHCFKEFGYDTVYGGKEHFPGFIAKDIGFEYICKDERDELTDMMSEYVSLDHSKPFLAVASLINPHDICLQAIEEQGEDEFSKMLVRMLSREVEIIHEELFDDPGIEAYPQLPNNHMPQQDEPELIDTLLKSRSFRINARNRWTAEKWRQHRYLYARLAERVDRQIGKILDSLYSGPNAENTIVIFTSDHGDHDGSHKMEHKTAFYKEAVEVPFIISWPNVLESGKVVDATINNGLDLIPTLLDAAGITIPRHLKGISILPLAMGKVEEIREYTPVENEIGKALWNPKFAYCMHNSGKNKEQFYDFINDSGQTKNSLKGNKETVDKCRVTMSEFWG